MDKNLLKITTILCSIGVFVGGGKVLAETRSNNYTDLNTGTQVSGGVSTNGEDYFTAANSVYGEQGASHKNVTAQDGTVTRTRTIESYGKGSVKVEKSSDGSTTVTARSNSYGDSSESASVTKSADGTVTAMWPKYNSATITKNDNGTVTATSSNGGTATKDGDTTTVTKDGVTKSFDNTQKPTPPRRVKTAQ